MARRVNLRDPSLLAAIVGAVLLVLTGICVGLATSGKPIAIDNTTAQSVSAPSVEDVGQGQDEPAPVVVPKDDEEGQSDEVQTEEDAAEEPAESAPEDRAPQISALDFAAGDALSEDQISQAGGTEAFFWVEPISDQVFARMEGKSYGSDCTVPREELRYVRVLHKDANAQNVVGELVVNERVANEILDIFRQLYDASYPIHKMHLVDDYDASDDASMSDDNTSCFNYRLIAGTSMLSNHAYGLAIDINPFENPYINSWGDVLPPEAHRYTDRSLTEPYVLHTDDLCFQLFTSYGWSWGGFWSTSIDYQHFEKPNA